jgi:hypothetical protein
VKLRTSLWAASKWCGTATVLGILATGCGPGPALNSGPLGDGGQPGALCNPVRSTAESLTNGFTALSNSSQSTVTIDRVGLENPHRLQLLAAYIVPITGHNLVGDWAGFPPSSSELSSGVQWSQRRPAEGAHIPPNKANQVVNLVVVLRPESTSGSAKGINVYYSAGDTRYHLLTGTTLRVVVSPPEHCYTG